MADYLQYVRDPANGYLTVNFPVADGMELQLLDRPLTPGEPGTGGQFLQPRPQ